MNQNALEVKWREKILKDDIVKAEHNLYKVSAKSALFFVKDKIQVPMQSQILQIIDVFDL